MATTFGTRPEDTIADSRGNVLSGVVLTLYATKTDALAQTSPVATVTSNSRGLWSYIDASSRSGLWARDPNGNISAVAAEEFQLVLDAKAATTYVDSGLLLKAAKVATFALASENGVVGNGSIDDTAALNSLLSSATALGLGVQLAAGSTVRIATAGGLTLQSGARLNLNGATLKAAMPGDTDRLLNVVSLTGVIVENGTLDGDKASYAPVTEQRHNIRIVASSGVMLRNITSKNAKGDGVYIGDDVTGYSSDITFYNVSGTSNYRNGISISAVSGFAQFGGSYTLNGGTSPQAGLDVEPNTDAALVEKIAFHGVRFDNNVWDGVIVQSKSAAPTSRQGGVRFFNCTANGNGTGAASGLGNGVQVRWANDFVWQGGEIRSNALRGVYFRDTCTNLRFDTDVVANGQEGYAQPAGTITDLVIRGYIMSNGTSGAAGTYDGVNLAGSGTGLAFDATSGGTQQRYGLRTLSTWAHVGVGAGSRFPNNTTGQVTLADDYGTRTQLASELGWRVGRVNTSDTAFSSRIAGNSVDLFSFRADGRMQWSTGAAAIDVTFERTAVGTVGTGAGHAIRTGRAVTGSRPSAVTVGNGAIFYDTTLSKPIFSDGTVWRDAAGTAV